MRKWLKTIQRIIEKILPDEGFRVAYGRFHIFRSGRHLTSLSGTSAQFSVEAWSSTRQLVPTTQSLNLSRNVNSKKAVHHLRVRGLSGGVRLQTVRVLRL